MTRALFIVGPSRSGTSVLAQALGRHSRIVATEELHYYNLLRPMSGEDRAGLWARLVAVQDHSQFFEIKNGTLTDLPEPILSDLPSSDVPLLRAFIDRIARNFGASVVVEQTPMNLYYLDEIRADFGDPLFVMMRRDPRAIIASQKMRWKIGEHGTRDIPANDIARVRYAGHPVLQLMLLRKTLRAMAAAKNASDVVSLAYEDLVTNPEAVLADLVRRVGLKNEPSMLEVSDAGSSHAAEGQRRGFDPSRLDGWRQSLTQTEIWLTEKLYAEALVMPSSGARPRLGESLRLIFSLPFSLAMAMYYSANGYGDL
ncbi:MAG: sulfotransferase family protein, partial [Puniceicoccales bacterium]